MTTYNASTVSNTAIASGKPITLQQGRALRDNPIAIIEGASGAPSIVGMALDLFLGTITATATESGLSGLGDLDGVMMFVSLENSTVTSRLLELRLSGDNGSTWGSWQNLGHAFDNADGKDVDFGFLGLKSGKYRATGGRGGTALTLTLPSGGANAFQLRANGSIGTGAIIAECFGLGATA